jgi:hypothetical protein
MRAETPAIPALPAIDSVRHKTANHCPLFTHKLTLDLYRLLLLCADSRAIGHSAQLRKQATLFDFKRRRNSF